MAIEKIVPDGTSTPHPTWTETDGGTGNVHLALDADDSNYAQCTTVTNFFIVSFANPTSTIASINSIRFYVNGYDDGLRGASDVVSFDLLNDSDSSYGLSENKTFTDGTLSTVQAGTARTTYDGSNAWDEDIVKNLRMKVTWATENNVNCLLRLAHLYIDIDYNAPPPPAAPTYDNTVNSISLTSGNINISSGNIFI